MKIIQKMAQSEGGLTFALSVDNVVDRHGDIVVVSEKSVVLDNFLKNPVALAFHNHDAPVGVWKNIRIKGGKLLADLELAKQGTSDFIDTLRSLVEQGILKAVSVGFRAIDAEYIDAKDPYGGRKFTKWELLEASLVSVPANQAALSVAKSLGASESIINKIFEAAPSSGQDAAPTKAVASATKPSISKGTQMKTIAEQISAFQEKRTAAANLMTGIMAKASDEGRTLDDQESEQYDAAKVEIDAVDKHLARLKDAESLSISKAVPVAGTTEKAASEARAGVISVKSNLPLGSQFARYAKSLAMANGNPMQALEVAKSQYPEDGRIHSVLKAAVAAGTTTSPAWAGNLVDYQNLTSEFIEFLRPQTIIGRFGNGGIPGLRRLPFNVRLNSQVTGGSGYWTGEGKAKPLTKVDFGVVELRWAKVANIAVLSDELIRMSDPAADVLVRDALASALIERLDIDFINPAKAAVANVSPASITNGLTAIPASGTDADAVRTDVKAAMQNFIAANISLQQGVWIMQSTTALSLSLMQNPLGQQEFMGITMQGGTFFGLPVIVSQHVPAGVVALVAADEIFLADDGQVTIDMSREAALEMNDAPTQDSGVGTGASLVSMFQTNSVAMRAERYINWQRRRAAAVSLITGAAYA